MKVKLGCYDLATVINCLKSMRRQYDSEINSNNGKHFACRFDVGNLHLSVRCSRVRQSLNLMHFIRCILTSCFLQ